MNTRTGPCSAAGSAARLLIHADDRPGGSFFESALHRLRARYAGGRQRDARLELRVHDLQGHRLRAFPDAGPLTDVPLPAGTYRVTAILGNLRRSYTMTLEEGASFDLHLPLGLAAERP